MVVCLFYKMCNVQLFGSEELEELKKLELMRETAAAENNWYEEQVKWAMQDFAAETKCMGYVTSDTEEHRGTKP